MTSSKAMPLSPGNCPVPVNMGYKGQFSHPNSGNSSESQFQMGPQEQLFVFLVVVFFFLSSSFVKDYMTIEHLSSSFSFPAPSQIQETSLQSCSLLFSLPASFQKLVWSSLQPALRMKDLEGHTKSLGFQERMVWS